MKGWWVGGWGGWEGRGGSGKCGLTQQWKSEPSRGMTFFPKRGLLRQKMKVNVVVVVGGGATATLSGGAAIAIHNKQNKSRPG